MTILSRKKAPLFIKLSMLGISSVLSLQANAISLVGPGDGGNKRVASVATSNNSNSGEVSKLSIDELEDIANSCAAQGLSDTVPGLVIAIVNENQIAVERGYGSKRFDVYDPVDTQTLFRPGSAQKMMTAAAVLVQQERNSLKLSDSILDLVPEAQSLSLPSHQRNEISIHNLLNHTSGIADQTLLQCDDGFTLSNWAAGLTHSQTMAPANTFYNYTNAGYIMAGLVAERAAGIPYADVMQSTVWGPSNMNSTFATLEQAMTYPNQSYGHTSVKDELISFPMNAYSCSAGSPPGLGFTTIGDLARWTIMLMSGGGETLSHESVKHMLSKQVDMLNDTPGAHYGYGVGVQVLLDANGDTNPRIPSVIEHAGNVPGWSAHTIMFPQTEFSVSVMNNGDFGSSEVAYCILDSAGIADDVAPPEPIFTGPDAWQQYEGGYLLRYASGEELPAFVYLDSEILRVTSVVPGSDDWHDFEAVQVNGGHFALVDVDGEEVAEITFIKDQNTKEGMWIRNRQFVGKRSETVQNFGPK